MRLSNFLLLLSFVCCQTSGSEPQANCCDYCNGNLYIPIIVILCQALLLSIAVNVYIICMTRYRVSCQNFYNNYIAVWWSRGRVTEPEQSDDQVPDDTRYSALSISNDKRESEEQSEVNPNECVYSAVKH